MNFSTNKEKGNAGLGVAIVDYLFVLTSDTKTYLIPCDKIGNKTTLNISNDYLEYEVKI